jgi:hypothetical protein
VATCVIFGFFGLRHARRSRDRARATSYSALCGDWARDDRRGCELPSEWPQKVSTRCRLAVAVDQRTAGDHGLLTVTPAL